MNNIMNKEEYQYLANKAKKIDINRTKNFCIETLYTIPGSIIIEQISNSEIISSIYIGGELYLSVKDFLKPDLFYYPLINHSLYLKSLIEYSPNNEYIYFGDTLNLPYGDKKVDELYELSKKIMKFFESHKVDCVVMVCGTLSSTVYERIKLLAKQEHVSMKEMINELLELGVLEKMKEEINEKK